MKNWTPRDSRYLATIVFLSGCLAFAYLAPHLRKESAQHPAEEGQDGKMVLPDGTILTPLGDGVWMQEEVLLKSEHLQVEETSPKVFTTKPGMTPEEIAANLGIRPEDLPPRFQKKPESD